MRSSKRFIPLSMPSFSMLIRNKDSLNGGMSAQIRYRKAINGYCDGVLEHVRSSSRQEVPTPEEYLEVRKLSSGCEPLYALVEYAII